MDTLELLSIKTNVYFKVPFYTEIIFFMFLTFFMWTVDIEHLSTARISKSVRTVDCAHLHRDR